MFRYVLLGLLCAFALTAGLDSVLWFLSRLLQLTELLLVLILEEKLLEIFRSIFLETKFQKLSKISSVSVKETLLIMMLSLLMREANFIESFLTLWYKVEISHVEMEQEEDLFGAEALKTKTSS